MKKFLLVTLLFVGCFFFGTYIVSADFSSSNLVSSYTITDTNVVSGDIVVTTKNGLKLSRAKYDSTVFGVVTTKPVVALINGQPGSYPIVRDGVTLVNVVSDNGRILKGDYITTSEVPGKGQKAVVSGYVFGIALADMPLDAKVSSIAVALRVEYAEINNARTLARFFDYFLAALFKNVRDAGKFDQVMRYIVAGLVVIASITFSFLTIAKSVPRAIEALGRNPMARHMIVVSQAIIVGLTVATIGLGVFLAIVILRI